MLNSEERNFWKEEWLNKFCGAREEALFWKELERKDWLDEFCKMSYVRVGGKNNRRYRIKHISPLELSTKIYEFLNGELLGDGHLYGNMFVAGYSHSSKYKQYLEWLSRELLSSGIESYGEILEYSYNAFKDPRYKDKIYTSFRYSSKGYVELGELRRVWYPQPDYIKRVPQDINLTPITLRQWYIGDGYNGAPEGNGIIFVVTGFPLGDRELLLDKLDELGFSPNFQYNKSKIHIGMGYTDDFLDYIGSCPIKCYNYKWNKYNYKLHKHERRM